MHQVPPIRSRTLRAVVALLALALARAAPAQDQGPESYDCIIEPNRVLEVGTAAVGVLQEVRVDRSDRVEAGQVVALLESGVEAASVDLARLRASIDSEVLARQVTFELQRRSQDRTNRLHATHVVAEQTLEEAVHDTRLSALRLRQAKEEKRLAQLELARVRQALARRTIRSPVDGVVMQRHKSPGERVEDQPVLRIAQIHPLRVEVVLPVEQYGAVRNGMRARVRPQYAPGGELEARVTAIDPVFDAASSTFGVRLALPNEDHAIPGGLRCTLEFLPDSAQQVDAGQSMDDTETASQADTGETTDDTGHARLLDTTTTVPTSEPAPRADTAPQADIEPAVPTPEAGTPHHEPSLLQVEAAPPEKPSPAPAPVAVQARSGYADATVCRILGPMKNEAQANRLRRAFTRQSLEARVRRREVEAPVGYLVAVELAASAGGTDRITTVLRQKGVRDYQVLTGRPGRVAVGYFRGPETARGQATLVQAMGLPAKVEPRTKSQDRFFLELDVPTGAKQSEILQQVLAPLGFADLESSACAEIVTAQR